MRIRITEDAAGFRHIVDAETGATVRGVRKITLSMEVGSPTIATVEFVNPEIDIVARVKTPDITK